uniref:Uncharacterized protein n=1 Tax=Cacopsylla melanoneura TaxID=428564 RepID=A0A8D8MHW2_9HEMI
MQIEIYRVSTSLMSHEYHIHVKLSQRFVLPQNLFLVQVPYMCHIIRIVYDTFSTCFKPNSKFFDKSYSLGTMDTGHPVCVNAMLSQPAPWKACRIGFSFRSSKVRKQIFENFFIIIRKLTLFNVFVEKRM